MNEYLLSIDQSLRSTGMCVFLNGELKAFQVIKTETNQFNFNEDLIKGSIKTTFMILYCGLGRMRNFFNKCKGLRDSSEFIEIVAPLMPEGINLLKEAKERIIKLSKSFGK